MSPPSPPVVYSPAEHYKHLKAICDIHRDCVKIDGTLATILDVDHPTKLLDLWNGFNTEVENGTRTIILQFASGPGAVEELAGVVTLLMPFSETGPHRCFVEKLLVSPRFRRRGLATVLMQKAEGIAKEKGRWLVLLDTVIGSGAEHFYPTLGYIENGRIPNFGLSPSGSLMDEMFFYKDLRDTSG